MDDSPLRINVLSVLGLLVDGEYDTLASLTEGERLSALELREAVESYGEALAPPPGDDLPPDMTLVDLRETFPRQVTARMLLWTKAGRSDLVLETTHTEILPGLWTARIDGIARSDHPPRGCSVSPERFGPPDGPRSATPRADARHHRTSEVEEAVVAPGISETIRRVVALLVAEEYEALASMTGGDRIPAEDVRTAVEEYGRVLVEPPGDGLPPDTDVFQVEDAPQAFFATVPLWTAQEGRSDLSVELRLTEAAPGSWQVRLDGVHVL